MKTRTNADIVEGSHGSCNEIRSIKVEIPFTDDNFNEQSYLNAHPDVAEAVRKGVFPSGRKHFEEYGKKERRSLRVSSGLEEMRARKMELIKPLLLDLPHKKRGSKYDFLTPDIRIETGILDTKNVSSNDYDTHVRALINNTGNGVILDCGAGRRQIYYSNVVNYEIVDYDTTDILGVGEHLPFKDNSFNAVISIAVLEHVRDPFRCASEISRVLKPGGKLICCVPFLQPLHGYPHHYYNMTHQGLRALFERSLDIDDHRVIDSILPVWSLTWIIQSWAAGLQGDAREAFLSMPLRELMQAPQDLLEREWVKQLTPDKNFELASATIIWAHKPYKGNAAKHIMP